MGGAAWGGWTIQGRVEFERHHTIDWFKVWHTQTDITDSERPGVINNYGSTQITVDIGNFRFQEINYSALLNTQHQVAPDRDAGGRVTWPGLTNQTDAGTRDNRLNMETGLRDPPAERGTCLRTLG